MPHPPALQDLIHRAERASSGTLSGFALATAALIHQRFRYEKGATHVQSTVLDALGSGAGVCQDFAHIMLAMVRMRGIPGRYVSGYLVPQSATGGQASAEDVIGGQASHAWMEMLMPGFGWIGLDPTMGQPVGPRHIRVAHGRDYGDAAPVRGVYKGHAGQQLFVDVGVRPALDDDGQERLEETAAAPNEPTLVEAAQEQQQQQQQQQQRLRPHADRARRAAARIIDAVVVDFRSDGDACRSDLLDDLIAGERAGALAAAGALPASRETRLHAADGGVSGRLSAAGRSRFPVR